MNLRWVSIIMENKKSLFEKLGLVEKVQTTPTQEEPEVFENNDDKEAFLSRINNTIENTNTYSYEAADKSPVYKFEEPEKKRSFKFDKHNSISDIYNTFNLKQDGMNTIFIIENFLRALPEYLPEEVKRQSLFDIIASSGMNLETLVADGLERLKSLNSFFDQFSTNTNKNILEREKEIEALIKKINQCKSEIESLKQLRDAQKATIDYESQKVNNILHFVRPSK